MQQKRLCGRLAAAVDVAVVMVGSADGTESEGYDRDTMVLSGRQAELVRRVASANSNTVVVVNSGMPVLMPWADEVAAIIQVWFPGQALGARRWPIPSFVWFDLRRREPPALQSTR